MTQINPKSPAAQSTTTDYVETCTEYKSPISEYFADMNSSLPAGWDDSFTRISGSGIICVEEPKPDCVTAESVFVSARQIFGQARQNPWRLAYADVESTFGPLSPSVFNSWLRADEKLKRRYEDVYQPFYFYDFGEEDFSRLRARLSESLPLLDENTQSEIRKLFYLIDGMLRHGRFDPSDVFFAAKVDAMASILSEIAVDAFLYRNNEMFFDEKLVEQSSVLSQPKIDRLVNVLGNSLQNPDSVSPDQKMWANVQILGLIDPTLEVPFYFSGAKCDLDKFSSFWDFLDEVLQGDFNSESPEEVVKALDAALVADLGSEKRFIDEPTKSILTAILRRLKHELSPKTFCEDSTSSAAVSKISDTARTLDTITQALWWAYNASDPTEVAVHSQFNPEPIYANPAVTLNDVFSVKTLEEISQFSDDVDYHAVQDDAYDVYEALASLHYVVVDDSPDTERENYVQMHWNDLDSLEVLFAASAKLFSRALKVNGTYPEPIFGIPQVQLQTRLNETRERLQQRISEVQAERAIAAVQNALCRSCSQNRIKMGVLDCVFRDPSDLPSEKVGELAKTLGGCFELLSCQCDIQNETQQNYRDKLVLEMENTLLLSSLHEFQDRQFLDSPSSEADLYCAIQSELYELAPGSDALFEFSSQLYQDIFGKSDKRVQGAYFQLPDDFLTDSHFLGFPKNIIWPNIRELNTALAGVRRSFIFTDSLIQKSGKNPESLIQLNRLCDLLHNSESYLTRQLERMA